MKNKVLAIFILMLATVVGCKDEKSSGAEDNNFKITIESVVKKKDDYSLYYTDKTSPDFKEALWTGVEGSDSAQKTTFVIPNQAFPSEIRLDFGMNKDQEDIVLKSVLLECNGKKREFAGPELGTYFRADETKCTFDPATGTIKAVIKDGVRQNPSLYPHDKVLKAEIEKLAK